MKLFTTIIEEIVPKTFVLTEAQAFDLLLEAASLGDVYQKYYNQIPEEEFRQIVSADPTSGEDKMGKYSKWLLALYTGGNLKLEDLYKASILSSKIKMCSESRLLFFSNIVILYFVIFKANSNKSLISFLAVSENSTLDS
jgi:hypothetical protein